MPIIIKDFTWNQTESSIIIKVPLRGVHPSKVDIFYSKQYLKASYDKYFFEIFLLTTIDPKRSSATFTETHVVFELLKEEAKLWTVLEKDISKPEKLALKKIYIDEEHKRFQEECKERGERNSELKRLAVREQMSLDAKERKTIENIKNEEKTKVLQDIDVWKNTSRKKSETRCRKIKEIAPIPPPRSAGTLNVTFTPRQFPTPSRESKLEEENEWLRKQAEARRSAGFISEDIRPEERNPQFLKAKGDEFFKNGNYLGAISAYSFGISLNKKNSELYISRSEAHLAVGNYSKMIHDCSEALELMKPEVSLNLKERALCIGRRGMGLIKLGMIKQGIGELQASLQLMPNLEFSNELKRVLEEI